MFSFLGDKEEKISFLFKLYYFKNQNLKISENKMDDKVITKHKVPIVD